METRIDGQVIKGVGGKFTVETENGVVVCPARGVLKRDDDTILVGDYVCLTKDPDWFISSVYPRKNALVRPPVSNIDTLVVVLAAEPEPDYCLLDKLLLICFNNSIDVLICVNKNDLDNSVYEYVERVYGDFIRVFSVSAKDNEGIKELSENLKGLVCFSGQSAVGKTSLLNALCSTNEQTGELSKILRGRNTTRHVQIYKVNDDFRLIDTCGFSMLVAGLPETNEIPSFYPDFAKYGQCKYRSCMHATEPDCQVRNAVKQRKIDLERYYRYLTIIGVRKKWKQ